MSGIAPTKLAEYIRGLATGYGLKARLIRGGLGSAGIQAANRVLTLALGIILARSLGAEGYGVYTYAFAIMSLLMVIAEAGVPTLLMREVAASLGREEWGLLRGALIRGGQFVGLVATCVSVIGLIVLWCLAEGLSTSVLYTTALMLLVLPVSALCKTIAHALRGLHHVVLGQAVNMLIRPLLVVLLVGIGFLLWPDLRQPQYAMAAQLIGVAVVLLVGILFLRRFLPAQGKTATPEYRSRDWLKSALPFTLIGGAGIINNHADIIMLGWFTGSDDVGIYRVAVQGATLVAFGLQAANAVVAPQFARLYALGDMARLQRLVTLSARVILVAALPVALIFIFAGGAVVGWVFGPEFIIAHLPLAILSIGQLINAGFGSVGFLLNMTGYEDVVAHILWQTALVNIALNIILIPLYDTAGAGVATSASLALWNMLLYRQVRDRIGLISTAFRRQTV